MAPDVFRADAAIRQQLCYVAVSRARTGVWLIGGTASAATERAWRQAFASTLSALENALTSCTRPSRALRLPGLQPQDQSCETDADPEADHAEEGSPEGFVLWIKVPSHLSVPSVAHLKPIITGYRQLAQ